MNRFPRVMFAATVMLGMLLSEDAGAAEPKMNNTVVMIVGNESYQARIEDNPAATAFIDMLPMTITMSELNGNEKYHRLSRPLPANASNPGRIENGDIMLYGSNTIVVFYKSFSTSYSYTRLGTIEKPATLEKKLGPGEVMVTFERR